MFVRHCLEYEGLSHGRNQRGTTRPRLAVAPLPSAAVTSSTGTRSPAGAVSCGTTKAIFSVSPVALSDVVGWVPLGNMAPSGHTFPTDHQYLYVSDANGVTPRREVNLVAPGNIVVTRAHLGTTNPGAVTDYTLEFSPCAETYAQFGHVLTIAPALLSQLGAFDQDCNSYSPAPGATVSTCQTKVVAVPVSAGALIGTAGGANPHSLALDFSLWDARVAALTFANPAHWPASNDRFDQFHVVPASDYFAEPLRSQVAARLGSYDGKAARTAAPVGGTIGVDVPGTAMGFWFNPSQPTYPETPHLAIAPDKVGPSRIDFSVGLSLPGWSRGWVSFAPVTAGKVNRSPSQITADGTIYCFESPGAWGLLLQVIDASTLRLESRGTGLLDCAAGQPWTFTGAAFDFKR